MGIDLLNGMPMVMINHKTYTHTTNNENTQTQHKTIKTYFVNSKINLDYLEVKWIKL